MADLSVRLVPGLVLEAVAADGPVLVWSERASERLVEALVTAGRMALRIHPVETVPLLAEAGAAAVLLVDSEVLDDAAIRLLGHLRVRWPQTRVVVLADAASGSAGLLRALRAGLDEVVDPGDLDAVAAAVGAGRGQDAERVLAVGAHPDDVEIGCGASLLRHRAAGHHVTVLTLSRGAVGGAQEDRRREAVGAALTLGAELILGALPDTRVEAGEAIGLVEHVVDRVRPTTIYVHSAADGHQDHRAVHDATLVAARRVPRLFCYQSPSSRNAFDPTRFVEVDEEAVEGKVRLLEHYRSQSDRHYLDPELVRASARYWARQLPHARYAEPFEVVRDSG